MKATTIGLSLSTRNYDTVYCIEIGEKSEKPENLNITSGINRLVLELNLNVKKKVSTIRKVTVVKLQARVKR